ncbi:MAG: hypothetical protein HY868_07365 [Chloroflexi bacterium]|nr:hypothetical protein [Chloroflexota bacterium]
MDYGKILTRAFEITLKHRALWLFGILFALAGGSRSGGGFNVPSGGGDGGRTSTPDIMPELPRVSDEMILWIIVVVFVVILMWSLLMLIVRFLARGALIGSVHELETTQVSPAMGRGFGIGWERWRSLFGIGLVVNLPIVLLSLVLILIALAPALAVVIPLIVAQRFREATPALVAGIAGSVVMICLAGACLWVVRLVVYPFYEFFVRACVIGKRGALDAIREGYRVVRTNLKNVIVLYILTMATSIGFSIVLIPVIAILAVIAFIAGFVAYAVTSTVVTGFIIGGAIGLVMLIVLLFLTGVYEVFESSVWTEGYLAATATPPAIATSGA